MKIDKKELAEIMDEVYVSTYNHFVAGRVTFSEFSIVRNVIKDIFERVESKDE